METVKYEMDVPKEFKEVVDLLGSMVEKLVAKAPIADYSALLPQIMTAVDGIQGVGEEIKSEYRDEAAGYLVHKLMGQLLPPKADPA